MASSTTDVAALLQQMSSLGIPPQRVQAATQNPLVFQELLDEVTSKSSRLSHRAVQLESEESLEAELQSIKAMIEREKELGPAAAPRIPRFMFMQSAIHSRGEFEERMRQSKESSSNTIRKAYVGTEKYFSETSLSRLDRIALHDMLVRKVHRGNYLLCRVVVPAARLVAVDATIEDPEGDVVLLSLYNFPSMLNAGVDEVDAIFPVGTILAIREPYQKMSLHGGNSFVRVDSPSDVIFVDPGSPLVVNVTWKSGRHVSGARTLPSTVSGWKDLGNKYFKESRWLCSAVAYTKGLNIEPTAAILRANRAEVYLKLEYYSAALSDAEKVLKCSDISDVIRRKVLIRAGKAEYSRGNFEAAITHFNAMSDDPLKNSDSGPWIRRANTRIAEKKYGKYDWLRLFLDSQDAVAPLDVAEYVGPIAVKSLPWRGGGRGVVATSDIKVGEVLVVARPFSSAFKEELPLMEQIRAINMVTKRLEGMCHNMVLSRMVDKIHGNPELHDLVYHLCPGPPYQSPPLPSYSPPIRKDRLLLHPLEFNMDINIALLENIYCNNRFMPQPLRYPDFKPHNHDDYKSMDSPSALYLLPSLFNHACASNSFRTFFREVMVIRATANIVKGDEITLPYTCGSSAYTRQRKLDNWNFICTCWLCKEDRADGEEACRQRDELVKNMVHKDNAAAKAGFPVTRKSHLDISNLVRLVKEVSNTYAPGRNSVRPALADVQHRLAHELQLRAYDNPRLYHQAIVEEIKALEADGVDVIDKSTHGPMLQPRTNLPVGTDKCPVGNSEFCVLEMLMNVASFRSLQDPLRAERWLRAAWWLEDVTVGGGRPLFEVRYKKILDTTGIVTFSDTIHA